MGATRLDPSLLNKLAARTGKSPQYIREQISRRASRLSIPSEAAQVLWAKEFGIGTAGFQRRLEPHVQHQIASVLSRGSAKPAPPPSKGPVQRRPQRSTAPLRWTIDFLLSDHELNGRCGDLLRARKSYDRVFREATVVLDERLKRLGHISGKMNPAALVAKVLHPSTGTLIVSQHDDERQGFFDIFKGLMAAFRNPSHHSLNDKLTREDALRFCGFIDAMLTILNQASVRTTSPAAIVAQ